MWSKPELSLGVQAILFYIAVRSGWVSHSPWIHLHFLCRYNICSALHISDTQHLIPQLGSFSLPIIWLLWCSATLFCVVSEAFLSWVAQLHWNSCRMCPYWSVISMLCEAGCHYFCLSSLISITHSMTWVWSISSLLESNTMRWKECLSILRKGISFVVHKLLDGWREHYPAPAFSEIAWNPSHCFPPLSLSHLARGREAVIYNVYCLIAAIAFKNTGLEWVQRGREWRQQTLTRHGVMTPFQSHFPLMWVLMGLSLLCKCHAASGVMAALDG